MHRPTLIKCSPRNVKIVPTPLELTPKGRCEGHVTHVNFTFGPPFYIFKTLELGILNLACRLNIVTVINVMEYRIPRRRIQG